jgi:hypothetical protein
MAKEDTQMYVMMPPPHMSPCEPAIKADFNWSIRDEELPPENNTENQNPHQTQGISDIPRLISSNGIPEDNIPGTIN